MFCPECGSANPDDSAFCGSCGFDLRLPDDTTLVMPAAPVAAAPDQVPAPTQGAAGVPPIAIAVALLVAGAAAALVFSLAVGWLIDLSYRNFTQPLDLLVDFGLLALVAPFGATLLGLLVAGRRKGDAEADKWTLIASVVVPVVYVAVLAWASRSENPGTVGYLLATAVWRWALVSESFSGWGGIGMVALVAAAGVGLHWLMRSRDTIKGTALVVPGALIAMIGGSAVYYMVLVQMDKVVRLWGWGE